MKLLMTADAVGGVWTYVMELTRGLAERDVQVVVATMGPPPDAAQRAEASHVELVTSGYRLEWMQSPWADVEHAGRWLLSLEREHRPDIVHLNGYSHAALPWRAPVLVAAHSDVFTWWEAVHGAPPPDEWRAYHEHVARGLAAADLVVSPTRALLDAMRRHYPAPDAALVVPNGLDPRPVARVPREARVLAVGRAWDKAKGLAALDAAAAGLAWPVDVLGEARPPQGEEARAFRHARALGRVDEDALRRAYAGAAVLAHPARYEPFGLAPLEAAHAGCALVLSDIPTLREVWDGAALYAPPGDADALRAQLRALLTDPALCAELAASAQLRARRYSRRAMVDGYLAAYERLARPITLQEGTPSAS